MSRSGYTDDCEHLELWRGAVDRALEGRRGQAFLKEMLAAIDALPEKRLIAHELEAEGAVCAIGAVGKTRGVDMSKIDPEDNHAIAKSFGVAWSMACEIMYLNDEAGPHNETPEARYMRLREWIVSKIKAVSP